MELLLHRENFLYHSRLQEEIRCGTMKKMRGGRRMFFWMDTLFPFFFFAIIAIVVATFVVMFVKGIREWNHNNHSPVLTVPAKVVAKREHRSNGGAADVHTSTSYYATFEVESGDRMELSLSGREYGLLSQGDVGKLTFQGGRYHRFERTRVQTGQPEEPTENDW